MRKEDARYMKSIGAQSGSVYRYLEQEDMGSVRMTGFDRREQGN